MRTVTILLLTVLVAGPAWAKPRWDPKLDKLLREAKQLSKEGDHVAAIDAYEEAYGRSKQPHLLLRIAAEQKAAGLEIESIELYERYLKHPRATKPQKRKVHLTLADLYSRLASLRIELDQPAVVSVNGKLLGEGMLVATTRVLSGEHTILAQRDGFEDSVVKIMVEGGEEALAKVTMTPLTEEVPVAPVVAPPVTPVEPPPAPTTAGELEVVAGPAVDKDPVLSLSLRADTDLPAAAGGPSAGLSVALGQRVEIEALALVQRATGLRIAGALLFRPGRALRPCVRLGASSFFEDDTTSVGVHAAGGVLWRVLPRVGFVADLAVEHYPDAPGEIRGTTVLLSLGARAGVL